MASHSRGKHLHRHSGVSAISPVGHSTVPWVSSVLQGLEPPVYFPAQTGRTKQVPRTALRGSPNLIHLQRPPNLMGSWYFTQNYKIWTWNPSIICAKAQSQHGNEFLLMLPAPQEVFIMVWQQGRNLRAAIQIAGLKRGMSEWQIRDGLLWAVSSALQAAPSVLFCFLEVQTFSAPIHPFSVCSSYMKERARKQTLSYFRTTSGNSHRLSVSFISITPPLLPI